MTWEAVVLALGKVGLNLANALVGAFGAMISLALFTFPDSIQNSWPKKLAVVFAGSAFSGFGTEFAVAWLNLPPAASGIAGLVLGLFGISFAMKFFDTVQKTDFMEILKARLGGR